MRTKSELGVLCERALAHAAEESNSDPILHDRIFHE